VIQRDNEEVEDRPGISVRIPFDDHNAAQKLGYFLDAAFQDAIGRPIVVVCVGTDRSTGDSFGPIVGTKLQAMHHLRDISIYGNLNDPVHAVNLSSVLEIIQEAHQTPPFILAVDACLGKFDHVGHLILEKGPLRPGAGVKKSLPAFGDYTLTGVVNVCGFMEYFVLQNTRLGIVMRMSDVVAEAFRMSWQRVHTQRILADSVRSP
jgi:putative sporulation protein YyaC